MTSSLIPALIHCIRIWQWIGVTFLLSIVYVVYIVLSAEHWAHTSLAIVSEDELISQESLRQRQEIVCRVQCWLPLVLISSSVVYNVLLCCSKRVKLYWLNHLIPEQNRPDDCVNQLLLIFQSICLAYNSCFLWLEVLHSSRITPKGSSRSIRSLLYFSLIFLDIQTVGLFFSDLICYL